MSHFLYAKGQKSIQHSKIKKTEDNNAHLLKKNKKRQSLLIQLEMI